MGGNKKNKKGTYSSKMDFINEVADDCILNMSDKDREYLMDNPRARAYHFSYGMYIRNHYIYGGDLSKVPSCEEPDYLSMQIIRVILSKLLPEYILENTFIDALYENEDFIKLRKEYNNFFGEYPVNIVKDYSKKIVLEPTPSGTESRKKSKRDFEAGLEIYKRNREICNKAIEQLIKELAELVWRTEELKEIAAECGIAYDDISEKVEEIKQIFYEDKEYIPLEVCLLPYEKQIGNDRYVAYRNVMIEKLSDNPYLVERLDKTYFNDRVLAELILKYSWGLKSLPMYQDDDEMVLYSLEHDGKAIQYAAKRFQADRDWVQFAIEHSENDAIMRLDCMEPYRKDKKLVYHACRVQRRNFEYVDKSFRDDFNLAKICIEQNSNQNGIFSYLSDRRKDNKEMVMQDLKICIERNSNQNGIFSYLSDRLKDNKELVMLDLKAKFPDIENYSERLRDDNEVAAKLYELHGTNSRVWYNMSKRLKKRYGISGK